LPHPVGKTRHRSRPWNKYVSTCSRTQPLFILYRGRTHSRE